MAIKKTYITPQDIVDWQEKVKDKDLTTSPAPSENDRYIIAGTGGDWSAGTINDIAWYVSGSWVFITPEDGTKVYVDDENVYYKYTGSAWVNVDGSVTKYSDTFDDADLSSGILTVNHSLGIQLVDVTIYNQNYKQISPDDITLTDANNLSVDLSSWGTITGTWSIIVLT